MYPPPVFLAFALLLITAALVDFMQQRIPNWIVLALVALFLLQAARHLNEVSWLYQLGAGAALLVAGLGLYLLRQLGAGDAKLIAAIALSAGPTAILPALLMVSIAGVVFAGLLIAARRLLPWKKWDPDGKRPKTLMNRGGIPYGVAIAAGTLLSAGYFPAWLWR